MNERSSDYLELELVELAQRLGVPAQRCGLVMDASRVALGGQSGRGRGFQRFPDIELALGDYVALVDVMASTADRLEKLELHTQLARALDVQIWHAWSPQTGDWRAYNVSSESWRQLVVEPEVAPGRGSFVRIPRDWSFDLVDELQIARRYVEVGA